MLNDHILVTCTSATTNYMHSTCMRTNNRKDPQARLAITVRFYRIKTVLPVQCDYAKLGNVHAQYTNGSCSELSALQHLSITLTTYPRLFARSWIFIIQKCTNRWKTSTNKYNAHLIAPTCRKKHNDDRGHTSHNFTTTHGPSHVVRPYTYHGILEPHNWPLV